MLLAPLGTKQIGLQQKDSTRIINALVQPRLRQLQPELDSWALLSHADPGILDECRIHADGLGWHLEEPAPETEALFNAGDRSLVRDVYAIVRGVYKGDLQSEVEKRRALYQACLPGAQASHIRRQYSIDKFSWKRMQDSHLRVLFPHQVSPTWQSAQALYASDLAELRRVLADTSVTLFHKQGGQPGKRSPRANQKKSLVPPPAAPSFVTSARAVDLMTITTITTSTVAADGSLSVKQEYVLSEDAGSLAYLADPSRIIQPGALHALLEEQCEANKVKFPKACEQACTYLVDDEDGCTSAESSAPTSRSSTADSKVPRLPDISVRGQASQLQEGQFQLQVKADNKTQLETTKTARVKGKEDAIQRKAQERGAAIRQLRECVANGEDWTCWGITRLRPLYKAVEGVEAIPRGTKLVDVVAALTRSLAAPSPGPPLPSLGAARQLSPAIDPSFEWRTSSPSLPALETASVREAYRSLSGDAALHDGAASSVGSDMDEINSSVLSVGSNLSLGVGDQCDQAIDDDEAEMLQDLVEDPYLEMQGYGLSEM
ncbi:hypothetical protein B484DRAFT_397574 [Ochromonadaceae sp. CCMP2298]|nr:hypothetical protein B484DRAFT_397574 [Ochromonadaceae sp. CCMP2298]